MRKARQRKAEREKKKADESTADRAARGTAGATWWIAALTVVLAIVAILNLIEIVLGGADTTKIANAADQIKIYAGNIKEAAQQSATAAQTFSTTASGIDTKIGLAEKDFSAMAKNSADAIRATQTQMRLDQRAWLGTSDYTYAITESEPVTSSANIINTGKTPAMNIACRITGVTEPKSHVLNDSDIIYPPDLPTLKPGTLFPNQHIPLSAGGPPMDQGGQKIWLSRIQSGGMDSILFWRCSV